MKIPLNNKLNFLCLLTNNHILNEDDIKENENFKIEINGVSKIIKMTEKINSKLTKRKAFTERTHLLDGKLGPDFTVVEVFDSDGIDDFLEVNDKFKPIKFEDLKKGDKTNDVCIFGFPFSQEDGCELSISNGKFYKFDGEFNIVHYLHTGSGASGGPIMSIDNMKVIGIHKGGSTLKGYGTNINYIINEIKNFEQGKINNSLNEKKIELKHLKLFVKTLSGKLESFDVKNLNTVLEVKEKIKDKEGISFDIFLYNHRMERRMIDEKFLYEYDVQNEDRLDTILRYRAGGG